MLLGRTVAFSAIALAGALGVLMGLPPLFNALFGEDHPYDVPIILVGVAYMVVGGGLLASTWVSYALAVVAVVAALVISPALTIMGTYLALGLFVVGLTFFVRDGRPVDRPKPPVIDAD